LPLRDFDSLCQKEILGPAISLEEEDERIYSDFGESLKENFPGTAQVFEEMRQEEIGHRRRLIDLYQQKFGEHIPLIRRQDVRGFVQRKPIWLNTPLRPEQIRAQVSATEVETRRFYEQAATRAQDVSIRQLLDDLAAEESAHVERAAELQKTELSPRRRGQG
jgi:rubrerythrin